MQWWLYHTWAIFMQLATFIPYVIGSYRFYKKKDNFLIWFAFAIILDITLAVVGSSGILPRMEQNDTTPWSSILFLLHVFFAGLGMFLFIGMFFFILIRGSKRSYPVLRIIQFKIFLPMWTLGVIIALVNFLCNVIFKIRIYDLI